MSDADSSLTFIPEVSLQDAQAIERVTAILREHPAIMPAKKQVSGHEFTRAVQPKRNLGFSPCRKTPQGLKAKLLLTNTARLKPCPDTCFVRNKVVLFNGALPGFFSAPPRLRGGFAFLRASVSPWCVFSGVPS
jgi:hypothetical protein